MSNTAEKIAELASTLPELRQNQLLQWVQDLKDQDESTVQLTPEKNAEVARRMASPEKPVSPEQADAFFSKFA